MHNKTKILCYGDSNTWGDPPDSATRYPEDVRWSGILQKNLGDKYLIIEEGLCGRTTSIDDPKEKGRNGKTSLIPVLKKYNPLDLVILMLGTNDLKDRFNLTAEDIAGNVESLVEIIKKVGQTRMGNTPQILLISPAHFYENSKKPLTGMKGAEEKSKQFAKYFEPVAQRQKCGFLDIARIVEPSKIDGCHFDSSAHAKIGEILTRAIRMAPIL